MQSKGAGSVDLPRLWISCQLQPISAKGADCKAPPLTPQHSHRTCALPLSSSFAVFCSLFVWIRIVCSMRTVYGRLLPAQTYLQRLQWVPSHVSDTRTWCVFFLLQCLQRLQMNPGVVYGAYKETAHQLKKEGQPQRRHQCYDLTLRSHTAVCFFDCAAGPYESAAVIMIGN